ncbi:MAG: SpoIID/LytB domain-containing protein [Bacillota bacterium]
MKRQKGESGLRKFFFSVICILAVMFILLGSSIGCDRLAPIEPPGAGTPEPPPLPPQLQQTGNEEPTLLVYIAEEGVVREMAFEEYIAGVVAGEMDPTWPREVLAAQAIIARTFTLQKIAENGGVPERGAHASTDIEEFQAYSAADITDQVREAVQMTRGEVAYHNNEFIRGWFSAYAGPRTAEADEGLAFEGGNPPYIQIVDNPGQDIIPVEEGEWSASFPLEKVRNVVREATGKDPGPVQRVEVKEFGPSGRAAVFQVNDLEISGPGLRLGLGSAEMRSTFLKDVNVAEGMLQMSGSGYGHGVGMCQWGARALAEQGRSPEEIVRYFYRDINIATVWE